MTLRVVDTAGAFVQAGGGGGGAFSGGMSTEGNTAGTTGPVGSRLVIVGSNNITLSQSVNGASATLSIIGGAGAAGLSAGFSTGGNTSGDTGLVTGRLVMVGSNNITLSGSTNAGSMTVTLSGPTLPPLATTITRVLTANSLGTVTRYAAEDHGHAGVYVAGVSNVGNTAGNTTVQAGQIVFAGGNNVTLSVGTAANGLQTVTISAANETQTVPPIGTAVKGVASAGSTGTITRFAPEDHAHAGVGQVQISGNTANTSNIVQGSVVFAGGNNITLSQVSAAGAATITISGPNTVAQSVQTQSLIAGVYDGANSISTGTIRFTNANGVSFSINGQTLSGSVDDRITMYATSNTTQSSTGTANASSLIFRGAGIASVGISGGSVVISVPSGGGAGDGGNTIAAGTRTATTSGAVLFSDLNGVSFGLNAVDGSILTASIATSLTAIRVSAGAGSDNLSAITFANSNGISFGYNASTITASVPLNATQSRWYNAVPGLIGLAGTVQGNSLVSVMPLAIEQDLALSNLRVIGSFNVATAANNSSAYLDVSVSGVLYTRNGTTLSSINSGSNSYTISYSSNATATAVGMRELTLSFANSTALTPGEYWMALHVSSDSTATGGANTTALAKSISMGIIPTGVTTPHGVAAWNDTVISTRGAFPGLGIISTGATRATVDFSAIVQSGTRAALAALYVDLRNYSLW